jgi:hypothetical protein
VSLFEVLPLVETRDYFILDEIPSLYDSASDLLDAELKLEFF